MHVDIVTLELVYGITIDAENVTILMTLTSIACPYGPMLVGMVQQGLQAIPEMQKVDVQVTFDPPWKPSDDLKAMMGIL